MSLGEGGKRIVCDGANCAAVAAVPVALRPSLLVTGQFPQSAEGWLFISKGSANLHFCPLCSRNYLLEHRRDKQA
jgi:hypothetical protein